MNNRVLVIGGSGVIGGSICVELVNNGFFVIILDKQKPSSAKNQIFYEADIFSESYALQAALINKNHPKLLAVIDLISKNHAHAKFTHLLFGQSEQYILLSSTLVYCRDRKSDESKIPFDENRNTSNMGVLGGYADGKISMEHYWIEESKANFSILRPYHVLGEKTLAGCLPKHNRDVRLATTLLNSQSIYLYRKGEVLSSFISISDLAKVICRVIGNAKCIQQVFNVCSPQSFLCFDYFETFSKILGLSDGITCKAITFEEIVSMSIGWELTLFNHSYISEKVYESTNYIPQDSLTTTLEQAVASYNGGTHNGSFVAARMNQLPRPKIDNLLAEEF